MKRIWSFLMALTLLAAQVPAFAQAGSQPMKQPSASLYQRLGGYDALAAVTDDFVGRLVTDTQLSRFFLGLNSESKTRVRQHVIDFLCQATGGPCAYNGQSMKTAHTGLNISEVDWSSTVKHLIATLDKFKVPEKEKGEVLGAIAGLKGDIVGR